MKKLFVIAAAAAVFGIVTPAAAQNINVRIGDGYHRPHHHHYGHRPRQKVIVVKKHRHWNRGHHHGYRNANRGTVVIAR